MLIRALLVTLGVLAAGRSSAGEPFPADPLVIPVAASLDSLLEPPEDVLKAFVEGLKDGPIYAFARGLASEKVEPEVAKWSQELKVPLQPQSMGFLSFILPDSPVIKSEGRMIRAALVPVEVGGGHRVEVPGLIVQSTNPDAHPGKTIYRLPPGKLEDLEFRFVHTVIISNPLNMVIDRFTVQRRPLTELVAELCQSAGVDYANRIEAAEEVVTVQLSKKKIIDCLRLAAKVGGMTIKEEPENSSDGAVSFGDAFPVWSMRQFLNQSEKPQPILETPLDVMRHLVVKGAAGIKENLPVILLLPKETAGK